MPLSDSSKFRFGIPHAILTMASSIVFAAAAAFVLLLLAAATIVHGPLGLVFGLAVTLGFAARVHGNIRADLAGVSTWVIVTTTFRTRSGRELISLLRRSRIARGRLLEVVVVLYVIQVMTQLLIF